MVTIQIEKYEYLPCSCRLTINGIDADTDDFGSMEDDNPEDAPDYGCGCKKFFPEMPSKKVLERYSIDVDEYREICDDLSEALFVGRCGLCA